VSFAPVARIASISIAEGDVASRLFIWKNMIGEIQKSPWTGVGAEHIDALFNRFYDPTQISEQWFDRSHNAFLDYAAQYGVGGLLLYLALIAAFITSAARFARRHDRATAGLFALLAVTYAVQNFFVFDTVSSFWLLLALLAAFIAMSLDGVSREVFPLPAWSRYVSWVMALALGAFLVPVSVRPALAAHDLSQAYQYQLYSPTSKNAYDPSAEISYLSHGFALGTYGDLEYGYSAYDIYANNQTNVLTGQMRADAYQAVLSVLTVSFNRYPYDCAYCALSCTSALDSAARRHYRPRPSLVRARTCYSAFAEALAVLVHRREPFYQQSERVSAEVARARCGVCRCAGYSGEVHRDGADSFCAALCIGAARARRG